MNGGASQYNRKYKINSKELNPNEPDIDIMDEQQTIPDHMFQVGTDIIINNAGHEYNEMTAMGFTDENRILMSLYVCEGNCENAINYYLSLQGD